SELTSVATVMTSRASIELAARRSASSERSARQTFMPRLAKRCAAARPMPLAAPVMTATRPRASAGWTGMATPWVGLAISLADYGVGLPSVDAGGKEPENWADAPAPQQRIHDARGGQE